VRVLMAEDDPVSRRLLAVTLRKWGFDVQAVSDGRQAWEALDAEDAPKLAILDWMMPEVDGVEVCRRVRQRQDREYTYIILLTARDRKQDILCGLDAGADDYVVKPFDSDELRMRLNTAQRILKLQADLIAAREGLRDQATHDYLTGLWNRSASLDILQRELDRAAREGKEVGLVMADLDEFKHINDRFGHKAGDAALCEVARRMTLALRPYDAVGRYGGDEFLIVLPGLDAATAAELAERLRARVADVPVHAAGESIPVTMTFGVTSSRGATGAEASALVDVADEAMYSAKRAGRNRVATAPAEPVGG
jgi:two-component system cell cycle response regulator